MSSSEIATPETENSPPEEKAENSPPEERTEPEEKAELEEKTGIEIPAKRKTNQGVRVIRGRVYDSENGKSCHQCRQKTRDVFAACKGTNPRTNKPCTNHFCHKCLSNRYGENAEVVEALEDWVCPKCRGICNCSVCMKKQGHQPTGILVHTAKRSGFSSVTELLHSPDNGEGENLASKRAASEMVPVCNSPRKKGKENSFDGPSNLVQDEAIKVEVEGSNKVLQEKQNKGKGLEQDSLKPDAEITMQKGTESTNNDSNAEIPLPEGFELCSIYGIDIPPRDVGQAFQFLEFCAVFGEMLGVRKGQSEVVLRDLMQGRSSRPGKLSAAVYFIIKMLSIIQTERGEGSSEAELMESDSWIQVLNKCISESESLSKLLELGNLDNKVDAFENMDSSEKLRVINFVCDEILGTAKIRDWIDEKMKEVKAAKNEHRGKVLAIKNKEKSLKQQMQDEIAKDFLAKNGACASTADHDAIISEIKREVAAAQTELAGLNGFPYKENKSSEVLRTEPLHLGINGRAYWKLRCMANDSGSDILQQDVVRTGENSAQDEKWFGFDDEQREVIEKQIISKRKKQGHQPTGILILTGKRSGFSSVTELLHSRDNGEGENLASKRAASEMVPVCNSPRKKGKENSSDGPSNLVQDEAIKVEVEGSNKVLQEKQDKGKGLEQDNLKADAEITMQKGTESTNNDSNAEIPMLEGFELCSIYDIDTAIDVGQAFQFLEFCAVFWGENKSSEVLRTEPVHSGIDGRAYWKLKCMANDSGSDILQQDVVRTGENSAQDENWYGFDDEQREVIESSFEDQPDNQLI